MASILSDVNKKVTSWDRDAHLDPSLTQRITNANNNHIKPIPNNMALEQQDHNVTAQGVFRVKEKSVLGEASNGIAEVFGSLEHLKTSPDHNDTRFSISHIEGIKQEDANLGD